MHRNISWSDKVKQWKDGIIQTYPKNITKRFYYETYACDKEMKNLYHERFIETDNLDRKEDVSSFQKYINKSSNKYVTSFSNLSGDCRLVVPIPQKGKHFETIKDFIDNASTEHQITFWKYVAKEIKKVLAKDGIKRIYVSTHGAGVSYFHLRLDTIPKYYVTSEYIEDDV